MLKTRHILLMGFIILYLSQLCHAQTAIKQKRIDIDLSEKTTEWVLYDNTQGLNVYYKIKECTLSTSSTPALFVLFKIENPNDTEQYHIIWDVRTYYGGICSNCDDTSYEDSVNLILDPGETIESDESSPKKNALGVFIGSKYYPEDEWLTSFFLKNLEVHFIKNIK